MKGPIRSTIAVAIASAALMFHSSGTLAGVDLPEADCGLGPTNTCLEFGDFTVYSLPLLQDYQGNSSAELYDELQGLDLKFGVSEPELWVVNNNKNGEQAQGDGTLIDDPYVSAQGDTNPATPPVTDPITPPNIENNLLFLMTTAQLTGKVKIPSDPPGGPDDATEVPPREDDNLRQSSTTVNNTVTYVYHDTTVSDPADYLNRDGTEAGEGENPECFVDLDECLPLWDADVAALRDVLDGRDLVFFFSNNENNADGSLTGQDLLSWAEICLTDTDTGGEKCFVLDGTGPDIVDAQWDEQEDYRTDILPEAEDRWVHVHSDLCVLNNGQVLLGSCSDNGNPPGGQTLNQSLGKNEATFAAVSLELSDLVNDPDSGYDVMTVDFRMAYLNNGGDWLAVGASNVRRTEIPVPSTLALLGLGLVGAGAARRRRRTGA